MLLYRPKVTCSKIANRPGWPGHRLSEILQNMDDCRGDNSDNLCDYWIKKVNFCGFYSFKRDLEVQRVKKIIYRLEAEAVLCQSNVERSSYKITSTWRAYQFLKNASIYIRIRLEQSRSVVRHVWSKMHYQLKQSWLLLNSYLYYENRKSVF